MNKLNKNKIMAVAILLLTTISTASAGDVKILAADLHNSSNNNWSVNVTLKHGDTGWKHYADNWRIADDEGNILGDRVLYHPHVEEQPFTRGLGGVKIPDGTSIVYIEAHDKVHGWTPNRLKMDPGSAISGRLNVMAR